MLTDRLFAQKEADGVYKWLTADKTHLKKNCKRKPPYDWSDIQEKAKDDAMGHIARIGNEYTSYYWNLATPTPDCPNWIARWFLYHKFRYRDGRNRNPDKEEDGKHHNRSSKHRTEGDHHDQAGYYNQRSSSGKPFKFSIEICVGLSPAWGFPVRCPFVDVSILATYFPSSIIFVNSHKLCSDLPGQQYQTHYKQERLRPKKSTSTNPR